MKHKYFHVFLVVAFIQLCIPIYLIAKREYVLRTGTPFLFSTKPIDPYDAFRGRYVILSFDFEDALQKKLREKYSSITESNVQKTVFILIKNNLKGYGQISELSETRPSQGNYFQLDVVFQPQYYYFMDYRLNFDRFYMDEFDAPEAEKVYQKESAKKRAYALVYVKNGSTVLADLLIDNIPIREYLKKHAHKISSH